MKKMTVEEAIKKFRPVLAEKDGVAGFRISVKPTKSQVEQLRELKPEIMAVLQKKVAEEEARKAAEKAAQEQELENLKSGEKKITVSYQDGEYLMGYTLYGQAAELLEELRLAKYVSGWGYLVNDKVVETLGKEFTYQQAVEYARPAQEARAAREAERKAALAAKFAEAKETGKPVLLRRWSTDCCDLKEECSCDIHYEYAMPDGSVKHSWTHTW